MAFAQPGKSGAGFKERRRTSQDCLTALKLIDININIINIENWDRILAYMCSTKFPKLNLSL